MVNLTHSVNIVAKEIISVVTAIGRIKIQNFDVTAVDFVTKVEGDEKNKSYYLKTGMIRRILVLKF
jgi:hypothetical protein